MSQRELEMFVQNLNPETRNQVMAFYGMNPAVYSDNPYSAINPGRYRGVDSKHFPGDQLYADLIRAQTQDYLNRFAPVESDLLSRITPTGTTSLGADLVRTRGAVLDAGANVQGQQNRDYERLGIAGNSAIGSGNDTVGALTGALNDTRMRDTDRMMRLVTGVGGAVSQRARGSLT